MKYHSLIFAKLGSGYRVDLPFGNTWDLTSMGPEIQFEK